jgi:hypothetical protein
MYACLSHLFPYNDICCSMYVIYDVVVMMMMMMMFVGLRPGWLGCDWVMRCKILEV